MTIYREAAKLAVGDLTDILGGVNESEYGNFHEQVGRRTQRRRDTIASAAPDIQALAGQFPLDFVERLARADQEK